MVTNGTQGSIFSIGKCSTLSERKVTSLHVNTGAEKLALLRSE